MNTYGVDLADCIKRCNLGSEEKLAVHMCLEEREKIKRENERILQENERIIQDNERIVRESERLSRPEVVGRTTINLERLIRKPPRFTGSNMGAREWMVEYEFCCKLNNWSDNDKIHYLPAFLDNFALKWYKSQIEGVENLKFEDIKNRFMLNYYNTSTRKRLGREIDARYMKEGEPVNGFIADLRIMLEQYDPKMDELTKVEKIIDRLLPIFDTQMNLADPKTFEELIRVANSVEDGESKRKMRREVMNRSVNAVSRNDQGAHKQFKKQSFNSRNTNTSKLGKKFQRNRTFNNSDRMRNSSYRGNTSSNNSRHATQKRGCFKCGRTSHLARDCFAKTKLDGTAISTTKSNSSRVSAVEEVREEIPGRVKQVFTGKCPLTFPSPPVSRVGAVQIVGSVRQREIMHEVRIRDRTLIALMDTGSEYSLISEAIAKELNLVASKTCKVFLNNPDGRPLSVKGITSQYVCITIDGRDKWGLHDMIIVGNLDLDMLVGRSLMDDFDMSVNLRKRKVVFNDVESIANVTVEFPSAGGVYSIRDVLISPRCQQVVETRINRDATVLMRGHRNGELIIANTVDRAIKGKCKLVIANMTLEPMLIRAGSRLAEFEVLKQHVGCNVNAIVTLDRTLINNQKATIQVGDNLTNEQIVQMKELVEKYIDIFNYDGRLGKTNVTKHTITLKKDSRPIAEPLRRNAIVENVEISKQVDEMLEKGVIEESESPWASAIVLVKKKNGKMRFCVDFRKLNEVTVEWKYPLPRIDDMIDSMKNRKYFTCLDLASGYWQIEMDPVSKPLTAFRTRDGQYQFKRMPFGLVNSGASFQKLVDVLFSGMKGVDLQVYVDDICVASPSWVEHLKSLDEVFKRIRCAGLVIQHEKCTFGFAETIFLGHRINEQGISPDPSKVKAIQEMPAPIDVHGVRRFLGMTGYYRRFVKNYAMISDALVNLTMKDVNFTWGSKENESFFQQVERSFT